MRTIVQVICGKGGVGKSMVCMAVLHLLHAKNRTIFLVDTDDANPDVAKTYRAVAPYASISLSSAEGWAELSNTIEQHRSSVIVINTRAASQESVAEYGVRFWRATRILKRRVVSLWVVNRDYDPVLQLSEYLKTIPADAEQVLHVVKNMFYSPDGQFPTYDRSSVKEQIERRGGRTLELPIMAVRNRERIYDQRWTIRQILDKAPIGDRIEMELWVEEIVATFGGIIDD